VRPPAKAHTPTLHAVPPPLPTPPVEMTRPDASPPMMALPPEAAPSEATAVDPAKVAPVTVVPTTEERRDPTEEVSPGPAPAFAEKWHEVPANASGVAAADPNVPANPFSEVSDGAIEYFVEWSLEQSIGPRVERSSNYSDVPMALPSGEPQADSRSWLRQRASVLGGGCFAAGLLFGIGGTALVRHKPVAMATRSASAPAPAVLQPVAPPTQPAVIELAIFTRPPGANVTVDGEPAGVSPLALKVSPGAHQVALAKERYVSVTSSVDAPGHLQIDLKRPTGTLRVVSSPPGAQVMVGGVAHGRAPLELKLPAFESYDVALSLAGSRPWRKSVYLRAPSSAVKATLASAAPTRAARSATPTARR
jgi:hypothetical protein